jgi:hypothetical protein
MTRLPFILPFAAVLALVVLAPRALAQNEPNEPMSSDAPAPMTINLPAMTVYGNRLPLPVALQVIKKGLKLPWTNDLNDARIRCRLESQAGSHFRTLWCEGNRHHIFRTDHLATALITAEANAPQGAPVSIESELGFSGNSINVSALMGLLHKIPMADASYTLRITAHGKPVTEYVIKHGEVAHIYHYTYKKSKPTKH